MELKKHFPELKEAEIEGLIYALLKQPDAANAEIVRQTGMPEETVKRIKSFSIPADLQPEPYEWVLKSYKNSELETKLKQIRDKYMLKPQRELDQFFAEENTSVAKALVLKDKGLIKGKKIALLGDDDLVSVVLGLIGEHYNSITVFDIDSNILSTIETISKDLGLKNIQTAKIDARENLNKAWEGAFDVVLTDPPYTRNGVALFLNVAQKMLNRGGYIFFYYGNSYKSPEKTLKVQDLISRRNLLIEDKIDKFARYYGAESIGSTSSLYILKKTAFTQIVEEPLQISNIYTFEDQKEEKFPFVDHYTFRILGVPAHILNSKKALLQLTDKFCAVHKLKVVDTKVTQFKGKGLSLTYILATSNLLVHTWPEHGAIHMDLVTCSPIYNKEDLGKSLSEIFGSKSIEIRSIE